MPRQVIQTDNAPAAVGAYSQAILAEGKMLFVSGQISMDPNTNILVQGIEAQTERAILNLKAILEAAGSSLANVVKVTVYLNDINDFVAMNDVYKKHFFEQQPARAAFGGNDLPLGALVEIECIALVGE